MTTIPPNKQELHQPCILSADEKIIMREKIKAGAMDCDNTHEIILNDLSSAVAYLINKHMQGTISRIDLELRSGISIRAIQYWRTRDRDPKTSNFIAFANALGYDVVIRPKMPPA